MKPELKIIVQLCEQVSMAVQSQESRRRNAYMPPHPNEETRAAIERGSKRDDGFCSALIIAIAQTDLTVEQAARLASGHEYERAAGFIRRSEREIEMHRAARFTRERIAAERGEEVCQNCGNPCDGSYCDMNCLEMHNAEAIEASEMDTQLWMLQHLA